MGPVTDWGPVQDQSRLCPLLAASGSISLVTSKETQRVHKIDGWIGLNGFTAMTDRQNIFFYPSNNTNERKNIEITQKYCILFYYLWSHNKNFKDVEVITFEDLEIVHRCIYKHFVYFCHSTHKVKLVVLNVTTHYTTFSSF